MDLKTRFVGLLALRAKASWGRGKPASMMASDAEPGRMAPDAEPSKPGRAARRKKAKTLVTTPSYGEGGLGWGSAPQGDPLPVTVGLVCPSTHVERVQAYIRDVFDLDVLSVSGEAFSASRLRELQATARANQKPGPQAPANGQRNVRVLLACPASPGGGSSSVEESRALAGRLEGDPLLARLLQRAIPLGALRTGEAAAAEGREREGGGGGDGESAAAGGAIMDAGAPKKGEAGRERGVGAWSGVAGSSVEAVEALLEFLPHDAVARVTAFPKVAQAALVQGLDARGIPLSPTANNISISAVVADSGWWHLCWSRTDPSAPECALHAADESGAASRAFFKLGEALVRCKEEGAVPGCLAIDVGAAPGVYPQP